MLSMISMKEKSGTPGALCKEARFWEPKLYDYADGSCTDEEKRAVEEHLAACPACRENLSGIRWMMAALKESVPDPERDIAGAVAEKIRTGQTGHEKVLRPINPSSPRRWVKIAGGIAAALVLTVGLISLAPILTSADRNAVKGGQALYTAQDIRITDPTADGAEEAADAMAEKSAMAKEDSAISHNSAYANDYESEAAEEAPMMAAEAEQTKNAADVYAVDEGTENRVIAVRQQLLVKKADRAAVSALISKAAGATDGTAETTSRGWSVSAGIFSVLPAMLDEADIAYSIVTPGTDPGDDGETLTVSVIKD